MIYLIEYDRANGTLVGLWPFATVDSALANTERMKLELARMRSNTAREIVILEANSEDQLRQTHRRYFEQLRTLADPETSVLAQKAA
jgi:hypothetical protein